MLNVYLQFEAFFKGLPIIRKIPGFNTLPRNITTDNLRFYKLSNLVLTMGLFTHASWILLFLLAGFDDLVLINLGSVLIYVSCIVINRKGYHFTSSMIMVAEILAHQYFAIRALGWDAGFQSYIMVITLFPFLMPRGRILMKSLMLMSSLGLYIIYQYVFMLEMPHYVLDPVLLNGLKVMNIVFSVIFLATSGGYFNLAMHQTEELLHKRSNELLDERNKSENLLLNILPQETATELKEHGFSQPREFELVSVIFTDFKNFTQFSETLSAEELVKEIHYYFSVFDRIVKAHNIEKIKTIGDGYMCVGGLPTPNTTNPVDAVNAALELRDFVEVEKAKRSAENKRYFDVRIGIHSGSVVAGIVGIDKFAYDIWGDTVNTASRMESSGEKGEVNISQSTYELVKDHFNCEYRGAVKAKNKEDLDMYFVRGLR